MADRLVIVVAVLRPSEPSDESLAKPSRWRAPQETPQLGSQWRRKGAQLEVMMPGVNQKQFLAGAPEFRTGEIQSVIGARKTNLLFRQCRPGSMQSLDRRSDGFTWARLVIPEKRAAQAAAKSPIKRITGCSPREHF
ncbi:MAG TPA: hypothetical protein VNQ79_06485 [Blastocatellia bacterium]|nr:hypothetical protein [Blastocatellia bacterium]